MSEIHDVAVVGAGPTGLALAHLLGQAGLATALIERNATTSDLPKAVVLDDEGARTLDAAGMAEPVLADGLEADGARYISASGELFANVGAGVPEFGFPKRTYFDQPQFEATLLAGLRDRATVDIHLGHELLDFVEAGDHVVLRLSKQAGERILRARYLVGADGASSRVREHLAIAMTGETFAQDWIVVDTRDDPNPWRHSRFVCDPTRPTAIIPAPAGGRRYEFMLLAGEDRDAMLAPESVARLLAPYRPYRARDIRRATLYTFHARMAERWREGRILLAGDAAHLTPPFAGQGMNSGLRDAHNLAWKLALVVRDGASPVILDSFEAERRDPCRAMILLAMAMGEVVMAATAEQVAARETLLATLERFPAVKDYLLEMRFKPKPRYQAGLFVDLEAVPLPGSLIGAMIPNPRVRAEEGGVARLDARLGAGFSLIAQDAAGARAMKAFRGGLWDRLAPAKLHLPARECVVEPEIGAPLRAHRDQIMLIRPDRYCAGAFAAEAVADFARAFEAMLDGLAPVPWTR